MSQLIAKQKSLYTAFTTETKTSTYGTNFLEMGCAPSTNMPETAVEQIFFKEEEYGEGDPIKVRCISSKYDESSPFCEFDDEFRELRRSRTESIETVSTYTPSNATIDTPYTVNDKDFDVLRSSIVSFRSEESYSHSNASIGAILLNARLAQTTGEEKCNEKFETHWWNKQNEEDTANGHYLDGMPPSSGDESILPGRIFLRSRSLPGLSSDDKHASHVPQHVPFSQSQKELQSEVDRDEDYRESVQTFINKIEVLTLELRSKIENSRPDIDGTVRSVGGRSRSLQSMSPLSPKPHSSRKIETVGKTSGEQFVIGSFKEEGHVKSIVEKFQSPISKSQNNLNGFFKPMRETRHHPKKLNFSPQKSEITSSRKYSDDEEYDGETENETSETDAVTSAEGSPAKNQSRKSVG